MKQETEIMKQYFKMISESHPEKFEIEKIFEDEFTSIVPEDMRDKKNKDRWILLNSNVSEEDILKLEEKFKIKLPSMYKAFISTYFHMFEELDGIFDDFYDEDNRKVYVNIIAQPSDKPLESIENIFQECKELIDFGYIPIGDFYGWGPLCFDVLNDYKLVWLDHEEYYNCETREELEELGQNIFTDFKEFMECFFAGVTHKCGI